MVEKPRRGRKRDCEKRAAGCSSEAAHAEKAYRRNIFVAARPFFVHSLADGRINLPFLRLAARRGAAPRSPSAYTYCRSTPFCFRAFDFRHAVVVADALATPERLPTFAEAR